MQTPGKVEANQAKSVTLEMGKRGGYRIQEGTQARQRLIVPPVSVISLLFGGQE